MDTIKVGFANVIAHRGLSGIERENTASAFVAAGNRRYVGIETDVHVTSDGKYILIHNDDTEFVAGDKLHVEETSYDTLRALKLFDMDGTKDRADLKLPNLTEYIRICKRYGKLCVLELKNAFTEKQVVEIAETFVREEYLSGAIFISFVYDNLVYLKKHFPEQPAQFLTDAPYEDTLIDKLKAHDLDLDIHHSRLTADNVKALHAAGIVINCWTVDKPEVAERLAGYGVDYITSNILEPKG